MSSRWHNKQNCTPQKGTLHYQNPSLAQDCVDLDINSVTRRTLQRQFVHTDLMLIYLVDLPNIQTLVVVLLVSATRLQILEFASKVWAEVEEKKVFAILHMRQFVQRVMHDSTQF